MHFVLPWQAPDELIDVQGGIHWRQWLAVNADQLHVGNDAHWIYHCDYTLADLNPVPS